MNPILAEARKGVGGVTMKDFITYCREVAEINRAFGSYLNELAGTLEGGGLSAGPLTLDELREIDGEGVE